MASISKYDVYAYQLAAYFVSNYDYQVIKVKEYEEDFWLASTKQSAYPMICIRSKNIENPAEIGEYVKTIHHDIQEIVRVKGSLLMIHTSPEIVHLPLNFIHQVLMTTNQLSDETLEKEFPGLRTCIHDVDNLADEIIRLTRVLEKESERQSKNFLAKMKKYIRPNVTMICIAVLTLGTIFSVVMSLLTDNTISGAIASGAFYKMNIVAAHEYFRILTASFVSVDIFGFIFLMFVFYQIGKLCEYLYKPWQYFAIFALSNIAGFLAMLIADINTIGFSVGAGIWGVSAAYLVEVFGNKTYRLPIIKQSIFKVIVFDIMVFTFPGMSLLGHFTGFVVGMMLAMIYTKCKTYDVIKKHLKICVVAFIACLLVLAVRVKEVVPIQKELDEHMVDVYRNTPLDAYADYLQSCYNKQYRME